MKIGIIAAMRVEAEALLAEMAEKKETAVSGMTFTEGRLADIDTVLAVCGEGKVNAAVCTQTMILLFHPDKILNTGVAGALSSTLKVPDVAVATATVEHDYDLSPLGYSKGTVLIGGKEVRGYPCDGDLTEKLTEAAREAKVHAEAGVVVSGDLFVADETLKSALREDFSGVACEMEGGAIGHVCYQNGIPYGVIRAVSDTADDGRKFDPVSASAISVDLTLRLLRKLL
ncbi:MAG: 5'-methylthioadenosine/adenosylhomocysteine nucleosidase [Clostridia bacterium]|nr:5'-methylthioadenosine/adenosylhomocysteine nucleosidase [Clostridia bacterium]